jgi:hypothetical protein
MGTKRTNDPSAIGAWSFYGNGEVKLMAVHDGIVPGRMQAQIAFLLADMYRSSGGGMAMVSVDVKERWGQSVLAALIRMRNGKGEAPPLYRMRGTELGSETQNEPGFDLNVVTKSFGIQHLAQWLSQWRLDYRAIYLQLAKYGKLPRAARTDAFKGQEGAPDDLVSMMLQATYIGWQWGFFRPPPVTSADGGPVTPLPRVQTETLDDAIAREYPNLDGETRKMLVESGAYAQYIAGRGPLKVMTLRDYLVREMSNKDREQGAYSASEFFLGMVKP